jgi:RNA polymerase sigma-70 factor, ECF subfamily
MNNKLSLLNNQAISDDNIVSMLLSQDENGLRYLYRNYSASIYGIISRILPSPEEANEVLNDTFLKINKSISTYDSDKSKLFTWMARIARNTAIDKTRSSGYKQTKQTSSIENNLNIENTHSYESDIKDHGLNKLIASMDADLKLVLDYVYYQGYSHQEAADALGMPLGTVKTKVRRAIMHLREGLKDDMVHFVSIAIIVFLLSYTLQYAS